jgi:hypothetical protein
VLLVPELLVVLLCTYLPRHLGSTSPPPFPSPLCTPAAAMLKDIQKLLGSLYYEYEYWVQDAWVSERLLHVPHPTTYNGLRW